MQLNIDLLKYQEQGFLLIEDFFSSNEISQFQIKTEQIIKKYLDKYKLESNDLLHEGFIKLDSIDHKNIHNIYNIIRNSDALNLLASSEKVFQTVKLLMNKKDQEPIYNMYHVSRMDPPQDNRFLYKWHQESYYTVPGANSIQLWAPLVDKSSESNGTIDVLVGSHKNEIVHSLEKVPQGHEQKYIEDRFIDKKYDLIKVEIKPGDALFFHPFLIHRSNNNIGKRVRYSLVSHYLDPLSSDFDLDFSDLNFSDYHKKRCLNYSEYMKETI